MAGKPVIRPEIPLAKEGPTGVQWGPNVKVVQKGRRIHIYFVIDTTGSMSDKIQALLSVCQQFILEALKLGLEMSFTLISFGDVSVHGENNPTHDRIDIVVPLTTNVETIKAGLSNIPRNNGYGNDGETPWEAVQVALQQPSPEGAVKVLILITDEPAIEYRVSFATVEKQISKGEFLVFTVATPHEYYRKLATNHGGEWQQITSTSNLDAIIALFKNLAKKIASVSDDVYKLGEGSVARYLLSSGKK